ncbi:hypothetical protein OJAV_G00035600 [Oryzias javanicus]|uniref:Uncharacterized protein n=1 Tax=Oryzias javanicus TaxID=123683 RepID=A0A3S2PHJ3_ORYJA|nr:hypothetical protein OJAV_G00035600 [Oryzias javanicus]
MGSLAGSSHGPSVASRGPMELAGASQSSSRVGRAGQPSQKRGRFSGLHKSSSHQRIWQSAIDLKEINAPLWVAGACPIHCLAQPGQLAGRGGCRSAGRHNPIEEDLDVRCSV